MDCEKIRGNTFAERERERKNECGSAIVWGWLAYMCRPNRNNTFMKLYNLCTTSTEHITHSEICIHFVANVLKCVPYVNTNSWMSNKIYSTVVVVVYNFLSIIRVLFTS